MTFSYHPHFHDHIPIICYRALHHCVPVSLLKEQTDLYNITVTDCHCRSPETAHAHAVPTCKADIQALGRLLVEMCTGESWQSGVFSLDISPQSAEHHVVTPLGRIMQRCLYVCDSPDARPMAAIVRQVSFD